MQKTVEHQDKEKNQTYLPPLLLISSTSPMTFNNASARQNIHRDLSSLATPFLPPITNLLPPRLTAKN